MIGEKHSLSRQTYGPGLEGLVAGKTAISSIDGAKGRLSYRGYAIEDLCRASTFEETSYLVIHGELPTPDELTTWRDELLKWREVPRDALTVLQWLPRESHPLMKYRTMLSVAACLMPEGENTRVDAQWKRPARILSWTAGLAASAIRHMVGSPPVPHDASLSFSDNFLWQALGRVPAPMESRAFEISLIAMMEHGVHAAAFAALVVISAGADLGSAVLAGMGALSGERHGGANQLAFNMFDALEGKAQARRWVKDRLTEGHRFPGFGHRVYKTHDPRVKVLEPVAEDMLKRTGNGRLWKVYVTVRDEVERALGPRGVFANVDALSGLIYHPLGLPPESFPIPFALAIQTGWMAHCLEYLPAGRMMEPGAVYTGSVVSNK